jgi:hypothetical protein
MKRLLVLIILVSWAVFPIPVQAACSAPPSDGYKLPGVMLAVEHDASGECFNVWLDEASEIASWLNEGTLTDPYLVIQTDGFNYNDHNLGYSWHAYRAVFASASEVEGDDIKPSDIVAGQSSAMKATIRHVVDSRPREWVGWGGNLTKIDVADITKVVNAWGETYQSANFPPNYDVYSDGVVDILDLLSVVEVWGPTIYDTFKVASSYTPGSCAAFNRYNISVSFENASGNELVFWTEARYGDQWVKENYIEVPDQAGGDIDHSAFEQPDEVRLMIADFSSQTLNNISWSLSCTYAPPAVIKITGQPDPFPQVVMDEASSAGTLVTVASQVESDDVLFITQTHLDNMNVTLAQFASNTGKDVYIVPQYSMEQTGYLQNGWFLCCPASVGGWYELNQTFWTCTSSITTWIPAHVQTLLVCAVKPPWQNQFNSGFIFTSAWLAGPANQQAGLSNCSWAAFFWTGQTLGAHQKCDPAPGP